MNMKRNVMLIVAMCMVSAVAFAQKTIRVSTDKTDLVLKVSPKVAMRLMPPRGARTSSSLPWL